MQTLLGRAVLIHRLFGLAAERFPQFQGCFQTCRRLALWPEPGYGCFGRTTLVKSCGTVDVSVRDCLSRRFAVAAGRTSRARCSVLSGGIRAAGPFHIRHRGHCMCVRRSARIHRYTLDRCVRRSNRLQRATHSLSALWHHLTPDRVWRGKRAVWWLEQLRIRSPPLRGGESPPARLAETIRWLMR